MKALRALNFEGRVLNGENYVQGQLMYVDPKDPYEIREEPNVKRICICNDNGDFTAVEPDTVRVVRHETDQQIIDQLKKVVLSYKDAIKNLSTWILKGSSFTHGIEDIDTDARLVLQRMRLLDEDQGRTNNGEDAK